MTDMQNRRQHEDREERDEATSQRTPTDTETGKSNEQILP
jgi:hypothetical protein